MEISRAERHQIENEMIFRRSNEKVGDGLEALNAMHVEDGNIQLTRGEDLILRFKCECSDENCTARIPMPLSKYREIHADRDAYIVLPHHQTDTIEKVISKSSGYAVVKKYNATPEPSNELNSTSIDNS